MADRTMNVERQLLALLQRHIGKADQMSRNTCCGRWRRWIKALPFRSYRAVSMFWQKPIMNSFVDSIERALIDRQATAFVG
ncbi:hypothetical protein [Mesorhizobium sp. M0019]|uniref:hypothetical protein n=1 Tax=Mesorhizobium sp. M0019 TaxID=2956845 RepID=UPI00333571C2